MTKRIFISPDRVTVSKPGYDAENPPAVDYRYLALDSRLQIGRPLEIGVLPSMVINTVYNFATTYPAVPAVDIMLFSQVGAAYTYASGVVFRDSTSGVSVQRTPYYLGITTSQFAIQDDMTWARSALVSGSHSAFYVVWQNW